MAYLNLKDLKFEEDINLRKEFIENTYNYDIKLSELDNKIKKVMF